MRGAVAVESAIGIPILLFVILLWAELCFLLFAISSTEHAFANAVFYAKKIDVNDISGDYIDIIKSKLLDPTFSGHLLGDTTVQSSISVSAHYFKNYSSLVQCSDPAILIDNCPEASTSYSNGVISIFRLQYLYKPLALSWFKSIPITREIITVQEYERCLFPSFGKDCDE